MISSIEPLYLYGRTPLLEKASEAELARRYNALPDEQRKATSPRYLERCQREHRSVMSVRTSELYFQLSNLSLDVR